jgi:hypothetical protein
MRLPSVQYLVVETQRSVERFPFVTAAALVAAAGGVAAVDGSHREAFVKLMVAAQLGIPMFFAVALAAEASRWPRGARLAAVGLGAVALAVYYATLPDRMSPGAVTRFLQFNVGLHLLVAFAPFAGAGRYNGFWQYNKCLFLRFLTAAIYSVVVYLGLSIALVAIDKLLAVPVGDLTYARLSVVISLLFNTAVFVGGVPRDIVALEGVTDYPRGLKVFSQYILIPLVVVYLTILTIYLFKVVITTEWPSGWIGYLVSSVAVVGILALLLVWPVSHAAENRWVATYTRWFFIFMIPSIVMLLMAVAKRIGQYGVTENRYFLAVLAAWLAVVAVYFIASRRKNIKLIPLSLCVVAFATSFGPWGAYTVARKSQTARLQALLEKNQVLVDGVVKKTMEEVPFDDRREISAISRYLVQHHGVNAFEPWFGEERLAAIDTLGGNVQRYNHDRARLIVTEMGIGYVEQWTTAVDREGHFRYAINTEQNVFPLDGADYYVRLNSRGGKLALDGTGYTVSWDDTTGVVLGDSGSVVLLLDVAPLFEQIEDHQLQSADPSHIPAEVMRLSSENRRARLDVYFNTVTGTTRDGKHHVDHFTASCFVTLK